MVIPKTFWLHYWLQNIQYRRQNVSILLKKFKNVFNNNDVAHENIRIALTSFVVKGHTFMMSAKRVSR